MACFVIGTILLLAGAAGLIWGRSVENTRDAPNARGIVRSATFVALAVGLLFVVGSTMACVKEDSVGIVVKKFGDNLPPGQIIARNGEMGPQAAILGPGWHFGLWPWIYDVEQEKVVKIEPGQIGIATAADGKPLPEGEVFAPEWPSVDKMLDAEQFLKGDGFKGPQLTVLTPGSYRLNMRLFSVVAGPMVEVHAGEVAVVKANAGKVPTEKDVVNGQTLVAKGYRGIWKDPLLPGAYYMNPHAYVVTKVSTTNRVYEYAEVDDKKQSDPILVRSKDGFTFPVDVRCGVSIAAEDAPFLVSLLAQPDAMVAEGEDAGRICILEARVVLPAIRTCLRNVAEKLTAFQFVDTRSQVEKDCSKAFMAAVLSSKLTTEGCYIGQIDFDNNPQTKALMQTRTDMEIAVSQQKTFLEQQRAQDERAKFTKAQEVAEQQKILVAAQFQVDVSKQKAQSREAEAQGEAKYIEITAEARKKAYDLLAKSIGAEGLTMLEMLKTVKEGNIAITPQVMVTGGSHGTFEALAGTILGNSVKPQAPAKP